jgi:hypothetical protein
VVLCGKFIETGDMTENDKAILGRWRDAEDRYRVFVGSVENALGGAERTADTITEDAQAYLGLARIEDPALIAIVTRIYQPLPNKYSSGPVFLKAAHEYLAARDELLAVAEKLDGSKPANRIKPRRRS